MVFYLHLTGKIQSRKGKGGLWYWVRRGVTSPLMVTRASGSPFVERAVSSLKKAGMRITRPRIDVVEALDDSPTAVSAYALHSLVIERGGRIDVVSVYRILSVLKDLGLVHYVASLDGFMACRLPHEHDAHTMHLVCGSCHRVVEVPVSQSVTGEAVKGSEGKGFHRGKVHMEVLADSCEECSPR